MKKRNARRSIKKPTIRDERLFRGLSAFIEAEHEVTRRAIGQRLNRIELALDLVIRKLWPDLKVRRAKAEKERAAA